MHFFNQYFKPCVHKQQRINMYHFFLSYNDIQKYLHTLNCYPFNSLISIAPSQFIFLFFIFHLRNRPHWFTNCGLFFFFTHTTSVVSKSDLFWYKSDWWQISLWQINVDLCYKIQFTGKNYFCFIFSYAKVSALLLIQIRNFTMQRIKCQQIYAICNIFFKVHWTDKKNW